MLYIPYVEYDTPPFTVTFNLVRYNAISYKKYLRILHLHDVMCSSCSEKKKIKTWESNFPRKGKKLINIHFNQSSKKGFILWWHKILVFIPLSLHKTQPLQPAVLRSGDPSPSCWHGRTELMLNIVTVTAKIRFFSEKKLF